MYSRQEYPRPQFRRDNWLALNGEWDFCFDDANEGIKNGWHSGEHGFGKKINVPFTYQYEASGIGLNEVHEIMWYRRTFINSHADKNALLCFNGCDYECDVWVNGVHVASHKGGFSPFSADITCALKDGENTIVVRCYDPDDPTIPRGKQTWIGHPFGCWYTANSGIWQSVWIEYFTTDCVDNYSIIADVDANSFGGEIKTLHAIADEAVLNVYFENKLLKTARITLDGKYTRYSVALPEPDFVGDALYWSPEHPRLIYVDVKLFSSGVECDVAHTRFGMRKISVDDYGRICLNNMPLYQRLILDQGYWRESGLTAPSEQAIKQDIELSKKMGFNGARKHQKFEDPYFYYYAEELGFLTWCEMPSSYNFNASEVYYAINEWQEILKVARNFTSVVCAVPLNESWGVRKIRTDKDQQNFARALYYTTKAIAPHILVSTNDGWENLDNTDIVSIHDYAADSSEFEKKYANSHLQSLYPTHKRVMADGCLYNGQPVLLTEFGGIAMQSDTSADNWGYNSGAKDNEEFFNRYSNLVKGIYSVDKFQGFCYTQLTDVMQEVNGLLTMERKPKFDMERIKQINENK